MIQSIPWYRSNTMRALLVGAIAFTLDRVGLPDTLSQGTAQQIVDLLLGVTQGGAMLFGMYARARQPTPPLALTQSAADQRNATARSGIDDDDDDARM
jgi:hypothetical protein